MSGRANQYEILHRRQGLVEADDHSHRFLLHIEVGAKKLDNFFFLLKRLEHLLETLAVLLARRSAADLVAWVVPVLALVASFFAFMLVAVSSPFDTQPRVLEGGDTGKPIVVSDPTSTAAKALTELAGRVRDALVGGDATAHLHARG